ncbi:glycosyltransferase [Streptomyces sp. cmx-4-7]|uniref:glycosyltransferase n=1 Tax=Streptomyces sp. cmx-4-7 TaxID=2790939 RepID=UPI00397F4099
MALTSNAGPLRVALVVLEMPMGGLEKVVVSLANELDRRGVRVKVVVAEKGDTTLLGELSPTISRSVLTGPLPVRMRELRCATAGCVTHLHIWGGKTRPPLRFAASGPVVATYHNSYTRSRLMDRVDVLSSRRIRRVIAVSDYVRDYCLGVGLRSDRLTVIHNGVRPFEQERPDPIEGTHCLAVARLVPQKDYVTMLAGVAHARDLGADIDLSIAGAAEDTAYESALRRTEASLGIGDRVTWLGQLTSGDAVLAARRRASVFLTTSRWEGFSVSVIEAMAAGQAIVASDIPPHREALGDAAAYFDPGDAEGLGQLLAKIADDGPWRAELGRRAFARSSAFSLDTCVTEHLRLYNEVLAESGTRKGKTR